MIANLFHFIFTESGAHELPQGVHPAGARYGDYRSVARIPAYSGSLAPRYSAVALDADFGLDSVLAPTWATGDSAQPGLM